jgi:hypothetical protein
MHNILCHYCHNYHHGIIAAVAYVSQYASHFEKQPMHTSSLSGEQWVVHHTMGMVTFEAWFMKKRKKKSHLCFFTFIKF